MSLFYNIVECFNCISTPPKDWQNYFSRKQTAIFDTVFDAYNYVTKMYSIINYTFTIYQCAILTMLNTLLFFFPFFSRHRLHTFRAIKMCFFYSKKKNCVIISNNIFENCKKSLSRYSTVHILTSAVQCACEVHTRKKKWLK